MKIEKRVEYKYIIRKKRSIVVRILILAACFIFPCILFLSFFFLSYRVMVSFYAFRWRMINRTSIVQLYFSY